MISNINISTNHIINIIIASQGGLSAGATRTASARTKGNRDDLCAGFAIVTDCVFETSIYWLFQVYSLNVGC